MTEKEKMLSGAYYDPSDKELAELRKNAHSLCRKYNQLDTGDTERDELLNQLFIKKGDDIYLQGPIQFDYGIFTEIGERTYINYNFTCLDCAPVKIGKNVFCGPNVSLLTPMHPFNWQERNAFLKEDGTLTSKEYAKPITICDNCWIAGNVVICGGVTIGEGSVIGAGSVVTRDIPPNVVAVGNPCRVLKDIE